MELGAAGGARGCGWIQGLPFVLNIIEHASQKMRHRVTQMPPRGLFFGDSKSHQKLSSTNPVAQARRTDAAAFYFIITDKPWVRLTAVAGRQVVCLE